MSNIVSDLKGEVCIIFDALKKIEETTKDITKEQDGSIQELKLMKQYKKLEKAFRDLSLDI